MTGELSVLEREHAVDDNVSHARCDLVRLERNPVLWFAYPYGSFNPPTVAAVRRTGYVLAVTTQGGVLQDGRHPLELHR